MELEKPDKNEILQETKTYRIYGFLWVIILSISIILTSIFLLIKGTSDAFQSKFDINYFICSFILFIISGILTYFFPLYSTITVDMTNKLVTVKKYRFLFLKNTTTEINTDTVVKAFTEKNKDESFGRKREFYHGFDLIFILNNGQRLVLLEGEIDKNNESAKLNYFLRDFFPGDYQDDKNKEPILIQMQTLTSQYKPINIDNKS